MRQKATNASRELAETICWGKIIQLLREMQAYPTFENVDLVCLASHRTAIGAYAFAAGWVYALPLAEQGPFKKRLSDISKVLL